MGNFLKKRDDSPVFTFRDEMERFIDSFFNINSFQDFGKELKGFNIDISEDEKSYHIESDLPGIEKENLNIELKDEYLVITAEKKYEEEKKERKFYRMERSYGSFMRSVPLPSNVDTSTIDAEFKNGVLKITIPKKESVVETGKKIEIK